MSVWGFDGWTVATIGGMAAATYLNRAGGYVLFRVLRPTPFVRTVLGYVPGALFVSYVVPALVVGGLQNWVGALATLLVMLQTRNSSLAVLGGTAAAWLVWAVR